MMDEPPAEEPPGPPLPARRRKGLRIFGAALVLALAVVAANHVEYALRKPAQAGEDEPKDRVIVRGEDELGQHTTIGIDESSLRSASDRIMLRFSTLGSWDFDRDKPSPPPEHVRALSGRRVKSIGFMYPLESGKKIRLFCVLRTTQTCCYGPRPDYNQYIFVEMREPVDFERLKPVAVEGKFIVEANPEEGYIYRMEGTSSRLIQDDVPDIDPVQSSKDAGLPLFDMTPMNKMKEKADAGEDPRVPAELEALHGQTFVCAGFFVGNTGGEKPTLFVGKYWWDGVSQGTPPDLFNAVLVFPRDLSHVPPAWKQKVVFTGRLEVTKDPEAWPENGIVSLRDAVRGVPSAGDPSALKGEPYLAVWHEAVILAIIILAFAAGSVLFGRRLGSIP